MRGQRLVLLAVCAVACRALPDAPPRSVEAKKEPTPIAIAPPVGAAPLRDGSALIIARVGDRRVAFVADEDEDAVHTIDLDERRELARTEVSGRPSQLLVVEGKLAVARRSAARVTLFAAFAAERPLVAARDLATADEPVALALAPDDKTLWVATGWSRLLQGFALPSGDTRAWIPLGREPRALAISADGARAFVGYMSEAGVGVVDLAARTASLLSIREPARPGFVEVPCKDKPKRHGKWGGWHRCRQPATIPERVARQTFALARITVAERETFVAPFVRVGAGEPLERTSGYGGDDFAPTAFELARIDGAEATFPRDPEERATRCSLPRAAAVDPKTRLVFVACMGSDTVATLGRFDVGDGDLEVKGGPSALAVDAARRELLVLSAFDRVLVVHSLPNETIDENSDLFELPKKDVAIALSHVEGRGPTALVAEGRRLFHRGNDAAISRDGRACASCHPDGRDDGLTWPTPNGPRQTLFLAGRVRRDAPFGWDGKHASLAAHVKVTVGNLKGKGLPEEQLEAIAAYVASLPEPPRSKRALSADEERGRALFNATSTGCATCHGEGSAFTDHEVHDVDSATKADVAKTFLAPSLRFVGGTAPYYHDGRYASLADMLLDCDGRMGATRALTEGDRRALVAYLRTL